MAQQLSDEELTKKFQSLVGTTTPKSIFRVKGKDMVRYSLAIGDSNPKFTKIATGADGKEDFSGIVAHPAFPASFTISALMNLAELANADGKVITNIGKLLHTGQAYDYTGCVPIKSGMKLYSEGKVSKISVKNLLWIEATLETKNEEGQLVCTTIASVGIRKGGFQGSSK